MEEIFLYTFDKWFLSFFIVFFAAWEYLNPARLERFSISRIDVIAVANLTVFSLLYKLVFLPVDSWVAKAPFLEFPLLWRIIIAGVMVDLLLYWMHRAMHTKYLWKTHWFHHSVKKMNWLKGLYNSATHIAMYLIPQLMLGYYLFGFTMFQMTECLVATYFIQLWQHANISARIGVLEYVFITPQAHRKHHSLNEDRDKNFGALFCVWDRMFGTYVEPSDECYSLGVDKEHGLLRGLLGV